MRHREDRLEHAEHGVVAIQHGAPVAVVARDRARRLEAGRIDVDHAHDSAAWEPSVYLQNRRARNVRKKLRQHAAAARAARESCTWMVRRASRRCRHGARGVPPVRAGP
ncbi:putative fatty acid/phospholipid synthesis protein PlsX [Burkholderia mallei]|nr:putative fatty acid/phospholipid synthesis protein PlsX [Burkholderia mallei]